MAADTTYDEVLRQARLIAATTESDLQGVRQRKAELTRLADAMQGAEVDPQSLGEMADMIDAHDGAEKALAQAHERITAFPQAFARRHGLLNEAHQSAPVPAAQRDFYQG